MKTEVFVYGDAVELEFTLADDCKFNVCLTASEAEDIARKLDQAAITMPSCARNYFRTLGRLWRNDETDI